MKEQRFDIHQQITNQIVAAIEAGAGEFRLPWHRSAGNIMRPVKIASKKAYRGVNILALWAAADAKGYLLKFLQEMGAALCQGRELGSRPIADGVEVAD